MFELWFEGASTTSRGEIEAGHRAGECCPMLATRTQENNRVELQVSNHHFTSTSSLNIALLKEIISKHVFIWRRLVFIFPGLKSWLSCGDIWNEDDTVRFRGGTKPHSSTNVDKCKLPTLAKVTGGRSLMGNKEATWLDGATTFSLQVVWEFASEKKFRHK